MDYLSPLAVANWFIAKADDCGQRSTLARLQRLTYFAHCWSLALYHRPLCDEYADAYPWGPVFPSIYRCAKDYGSGTIKSLLVADLDHSPTVQAHDPRIALLLKIWDTYNSFNDAHLLKVAREDGGPWHVTMSRNRGRKHPNIDENLIISHFRSKMQN